MQQNGMKLTAIEKKSAEKVFETISKVYSEEVSYSTYNKYIESAPKYINKIDDTISIVKTVTYGAVIFCAVIILLVNIKQFRIGLKYIGIAILASGAFMIGINIFLKCNMDIANLIILNKATSNLIVTILLDILSKINLSGIISVVVGLVGVVIGATYQKET